MSDKFLCSTAINTNSPFSWWRKVFSIFSADMIAMACGLLLILRPFCLITAPQWVTNTLNVGIKIHVQRQGVVARLEMEQKLIFSDGSEGYYRHQQA